MLKSLLKNRCFFILSVICILYVQITALLKLISAAPAPEFVIVYIWVSIWTHVMLWNGALHDAAAVWWSVMTTMLIGSWAIPGLVCFWIRICSRKKSSIIKMHARIPFLRIPIPWYTYTLNLENNFLTRDPLFAGKEDSEPDQQRKHKVFGDDDDLYLGDVFDSKFSSKGYRILSGTMCFSFQSKKVGKTKYVHWHLMPTYMHKPLRKRLRELKQHKKS